MMALFAMPFSRMVFIPFDIAIATWLVVLGALVTRGVEQEPASGLFRAKINRGCRDV